MKFMLEIVKVDSNYCDYLREFDSKVPYNKGIKELRPFIGILFEIDDCKYFTPLSSPKNKHKLMKNGIDFFKIDDGNLGVINFNNMIPVQDNNYSLIDLNAKCTNNAELKYQNLLKQQLAWLNAHYKQVKSKSFKLYKLYKEDKLPEKVKIRCCNFPLLEEKCREYKMVII